ncbi:hypothetical protein HID58_027931 [Brassica napus]|uniref:S-protein homolog n=1 Tax=Brassica napus TaxID=3708 RepID=A0ABQ8CVH9_BRANA|nr:hypothetical protein HID58_027931 [Brassica napus]
MRRKRLLPLQKKTVEIINFALNKEVINLHCSSSEDDLGYSFKFKVNWKGTTKLCCHVTWRGGGDHWFTVFNRGRGQCSKVVWQIYGYGALDKPLMLLDCNGGNGYRFYDWDT